MGTMGIEEFYAQTGACNAKAGMLAVCIMIRSITADTCIRVLPADET